MKKHVFSKEVRFCLHFAKASLLGHKFGLALLLGKLLLITTGGHLYRRPLSSPSNRLRKEVVHIPFERGDSKDYRNIKIFSIGCEIAEHEVKQETTLFCRRY